MASQGILKQGFLVKKGHVRHNWRTRWFVLMRKELSYFKKKEDRFPAGVIPLVGAALVCPPPEDSKKPWLLQITTHERREFLIQAPDQASRDEWRDSIEDCIRRLDPAKINKEMSPTRTLARTDTYVSVSEDYRDVVQAMQDPKAGLKLHEIRAKGARQITRYFSGKELIDWLITWSFANNRSEAISMATGMLRYGFFHPVQLDLEEGVCAKLNDSILCTDIGDSDDANYIFVVFAPGMSLDLFRTGEWGDEDCEFDDNDSDHDSDSDDDILSNRARVVNNDVGGVDMGDGRILKQGFLLKKGQFRHNWKARKFVLKEKNPMLYYFRGSKDSKPQGTIPLKDLTVTPLDDAITQTLPTSSSQISGTDTLPVGKGCIPVKVRQRKSTEPKVNRFLLITSTGVRYELQAVNAEEREVWISQLKIASKLA